MKDIGRNTLTRSFYEVVRPANVPDWGSGYFVPSEIFNKYSRIYAHTKRMIGKLAVVLDDPEHQSAMAEAAMRGYRLPDLDLFRDELAAYRDFLDGFNPGDARSGKPGTTYVPRQLARDLTHMVAHNCVVLSQIFNGSFRTDYFQTFKDMRRDGRPYRGPGALGEIDNLLARMWAIRREEALTGQPEIVFLPPPMRKDGWPSWLRT